METWAPRAMAALPLLALLLFFLVPISNGWLFFLIVPIGGAVLGAATRGHDRDQYDHRRRERGERRIDRREQRRGLGPGAAPDDRRGG